MTENLSLLMDLYELTMAEVYLDHKAKARATFDLFVRDLPAQRKFLVACGLNDILDYLKALRFSQEDLKYLRSQRIFSEKFLQYLEGFRFSGDLWAIPEGEIFFANEPVVRVTAPIIEAQIIESFLLNTINLQTMIASKAARVVLAAGAGKVYDFALRRTHGADAGIKVARSAFIAGFSGTSNVLAGKFYKIPVVGTMAHSFVMSFKRELDSFLAYSDTFSDKSILLVDTYDTRKGIKNAITVGRRLKAEGDKLLAIRLDSGDIVSLSKMARRMLDQAELSEVKIFASGNLDEFKIKRLLKNGARVDSFGVGTNMGTSIDAPCLDVIYKISEVTDENHAFLPTMKLSRGKATYPGRKQVFRVCDGRGRPLRDILGLEKERISARPLLKKVVSGGRIIYKQPGLDKIRSSCRRRLLNLTDKLKDDGSKYEYPVLVSAKLKSLRRRLSRQLKKRQ